MKISKKLFIKGRVQGVWFRRSAQNRALELDLCGFVMNRLDGGVYSEVEGEEGVVEEFIKWCWTGPQRARVRDVDEEVQEVKGYAGFEVR